MIRAREVSVFTFVIGTISGVWYVAVTLVSVGVLLDGFLGWVTHGVLAPSHERRAKALTAGDFGFLVLWSLPTLEMVAILRVGLPSVWGRSVLHRRRSRTVGVDVWRQRRTYLSGRRTAFRRLCIRTERLRRPTCGLTRLRRSSCRLWRGSVTSCGCSLPTRRQ